MEEEDRVWLRRLLQEEEQSGRVCARWIVVWRRQSGGVSGKAEKVLRVFESEDGLVIRGEQRHLP